MRIARIELDGIGPFDGAVFKIPEPPAGSQGELVLFEGPNGSGKTTIMETLAMFVVGTYGAMRLGVPPFPPPMEYTPTPTEFTHGLEHWHLRFRPDRSGTASVTWNTAATAASTLRIQRDPSLPLENFGPGAILGQLRNQRALDSKALSDEIESLHAGLAAAEFNPTPASLPWAAFAFRGHQETPGLRTEGPKVTSAPPTIGALSFGHQGIERVSLGQFLTNLEYDRVRAAQYAQEMSLSVEERQRYTGPAEHYRRTLEDIKQAFSHLLERKVNFQFHIGEPFPRMLFDGEEIPLDLLGEGLRSTVAWLSDLMVRLLRMLWTRADILPFKQHFWLILDEIDESLHPRMQRRLFPALRELFPNACIYATTHSPFAVASVTEGQVFSLRPDPKTHRVSGHQKPIPLVPGQSLEFIVQAVFDAPARFVDQPTLEHLEEHRKLIADLQAGKSIDWEALTRVRHALMALNEELRTVVALRELPVVDVIEAHEEQPTP